MLHTRFKQHCKKTCLKHVRNTIFINSVLYTYILYYNFNITE